MNGFLEHVRDHYAGPGDEWFRRETLKLSDHDPSNRRIVGMGKSEGMVVINARPVGGRNAGSYRGWITLDKGDLRRIKAPVPNGWTGYTVVVGYAPDDETYWYSALYRDTDLARLDWEPMDRGEWFRAEPDQVGPIVLKEVDLYAPIEMFVPEAMRDAKTGKMWQDQHLRQMTPLELLELFREAIDQPGFQWEDLDHKSPRYVQGRGNKQLVILASILLNRPDRQITYNEAKQVVARAVGARSFQVPEGV